jgi:hypothetical protein
LELAILLPLPPECWNYRHGPPCSPTLFIANFLLPCTYLDLSQVMSVKLWFGH